MIKLKKIISSFLAMGMIMSCAQSITFAEGTSIITWKETIGDVDQSVSEVYDSATGTFGQAGRTVVHTTTTASQTYCFGVELPTAVKSGKVVVDAEFSGVVADDNRRIRPFSLSSEAKGWAGTVVSGMEFRYTNVALGNGDGYKGCWNADAMGTATSIKADVYKLKFVAEAEDENSQWVIKIYHEETNKTIPVFTYTIPRANLGDIKYIINTNWIGKNKTAQITVNKFKVKIFDANYGKDFSATYVDDDTDDYTDRTVRIDVLSDVTPIADINAVDAYIVNEETGEKTPLDSSNVSYENGVAQITVPTSFYGILSIDLVLKTEGGDFTLNVPLTGNPFEDEYILSLELKEISQGVVGETVKVKLDFQEIVLKFNNNIDDTTLGAVTFTGEGVENLQKSLTDDDKTLTISFDPLIDKETYTLNIGTGLKSKNGYYISEEITYQYQVDSDLTKLNITSHNTETNYILLPNAKKLEIEFNFDLDSATLASGIKFVNADGTSIPGGYNVEMGNSAKQAIITFGRLRKGEYKLVTTSLLKAQEDGITTIEDEWSFKVETEDDEPIVYGEFSDFVEGDISNTQLGNGNASFASSTYEIVTTDGGIKYVTSKGSQTAKGGGITITLPQSISKGKIAFDFSFKAVGGKIKRNIFTAADSSGNKVYTIQVNDTNNISKNGEKATAPGEFKSSGYTTDADEFYNLRIVYMAEDELSDWTVQIYDKLASMTEPIYQGKIGRVYDSASSKYGLPNISKMSLFDIWWMSGDDANGAGVAVKEYAYHVLPVPQVLSSNLEAAQPDTNKFELDIDSDLAVDLLSQETVTLTAGDTTIPATVSYDALDRKLTITPNEYLEYGTTYQIKFAKFICENVTFETPQRPVSMTTNPALVETDGVKSVQISATKNSGEAATICAIAKIFDAEGNLIKIIGDDSMSLTDELPLTDVAWEAGYTVKTFIWASQNGLIYPISSPVELTNQ